jgi:hypothetical protein
MPRVKFEPTIPVFERAKTVHGRADHCDRLDIIITSKIEIRIRMKSYEECGNMFQHAINHLPTQTELNSADISAEHMKWKCRRDRAYVRVRPS